MEGWEGSTPVLQGHPRHLAPIKQPRNPHPKGAPPEALEDEV